ncbi:MAG: amino acid transport protein [Verrucomicrobia bacterium]|nr:MAG: amino acid transport protein [Verrucomicrobiota bacterium]TAE89084.1 MAG: amino acid transport protein [Verrucomicrobiota bacterium]TAF28043.1 MAG: amino acid transport protein [Verrucomicrobiota bacterium]TAF42890.1 MAG: amino acid transport protein [Verrucomicrobiota bacterium]
MSFEPYNLLAGLVFGTLGWGAWRYGRSLDRTKPVIIGLVMMIYPYFTPWAWLTWSIGTLLMMVLWFHHDA